MKRLPEFWRSRNSSSEGNRSSGKEKRRIWNRRKEIVLTENRHWRKMRRRRRRKKGEWPWKILEAIHVAEVPISEAKTENIFLLLCNTERERESERRRKKQQQLYTEIEWAITYTVRTRIFLPFGHLIWDISHMLGIAFWNPKRKCHI